MGGDHEGKVFLAPPSGEYVIQREAEEAPMRTAGEHESRSILQVKMRGIATRMVSGCCWRGAVGSEEVESYRKSPESDSRSEEQVSFHNKMVPASVYGRFCDGQMPLWPMLG